MARSDVTARWLERGRRLGARAEAARSGSRNGRLRIPALRARRVDRRRPARRRARLQALRPPPADGAAVRLGPRPLCGRRRQEHRRGGQGGGPARVDRLSGRVGLVGRCSLARLHPDGSRGALRDGHPLPCAGDRARDRLAGIGSRRPRDAERNRGVVRGAPARDRRRPDRGLDPPARPAGRALRAARLPRARRRRVAAGLAAAATPRRPRGTPSSRVPRWWAWASCS